MQYPEDQASDNTPPRYPGADYYQDLAAQAKQQQAARPIPQKYADNPYLPPVQPAQTMRSHNAFTRFVVSWGGMNRLWISLGSAALSVVVYTYFFQQTWAFGFGLVGLICVHELGHDIALRRKNLPATFPIFIPLIGAYVTLPRQPISLRDSADISLAGPFMGGIGALACLIASFVFLQHYPNGFVSPNTTLSNLAYFSFYINLLNLLPVLPLDGGHVAATLSRYLSVVGIALLAALYFIPFAGNPLYQNYFVLLIGFWAISDVMRSFNTTGRQMVMRTADRVTVSIMYGGLAFLLAMGYWLSTNQDIALSILRWRVGASS